MKIKIAHLDDGVHEFQFSIGAQKCGSDLLENFVNPIDATVSIQKFFSNYISDLKITTQGSFICDRCLKEYLLEITNSDRITFTLDPSLSDSSESGIRMINPQTMEIDFTEDIRELLLLAVPSKKLCSSDCKGLCSGCGADLNHETCTCTYDKIDPRWDALKKLINS